MKAIINATIYDFNSYKENQYVLYDERIVEVGHMTDFQNRDYECIDGSGAILMPGLINGHNHIYSTFARGLSVPFQPKNFQDILDQLWWKLDGQLDLDAIYYSAIVNGVEAVSCGITTMIDHHASGLDIRHTLDTIKEGITDEVGLRGIYCFETSDRFDIDECIEENISFIELNKSTKVAGMFGMHASMSLSDDSLKKIGSVIKDYPIHIHVAESAMDQNLSIEDHNERITQRLDRYKLLNPNSLLVHCLYIDHSEAKIIKNRKCKIVVNPTSNMNNGVGLPDYQLFKSTGIDVLIGNDGISSGITTEWQNLLYGMHLKYSDPRAFGFEDLLKCINNGYTYASELLGCKLGRLEVGYEADMLLIPYEPPTPMNKDNIFGHLFFGLFSNFRPQHVWCEGHQLVTDYKVSDLLEHTYKNAKISAKKVWERIDGKK